ncbi:FKBP-type peptidyl-prolyl cis-trans isomerase [Prevotella sp. E2-28]|jgi:FKBP-type peptidyl-prolyl cis-trans isomerase FklB|uniref:FKBP-type peptidyl-prolyl cis-trans isomerase n=1 Tax=Prevotella sp. E2-28 TaxID=2913620 RepID=UPI001EDC4CB2|nr:FKBP-type peptidyl-prolyl cis-trans isomerase [Prevotella sp. E2-28]UKK53528.1 FKBP-type peptidyl-prolyl cis-trans isomerase [Prevotella sp. E2-28]
MKKYFSLATVALAVAAMMSCNGNSPKASLKTDVDTLSYAIGMAQTQNLMDYLSRAKGVDTTYIAEFLQGVNDGANSADDKKKAAYLAGVEIGQQIANNMVTGLNYQLFGEDTTQTVSLNNILAGFVSGVLGKDGKMTVQEADSTANALFESIKAKAQEKQYGANKVAGEKFLAENAKKEGVQKLPCGVQYKVLKAGNGATPSDTSTVVVNYEGRLIDGTVFDASARHGDEPASFQVGRVIKGWQEALKAMPAGSEWEIYIPQHLAYGANQSGQIPPFSTLIFKVELVEVK